MIDMTDTNQEKTAPSSAEAAPPEAVQQDQLLTPSLVSQFEQALEKDNNEAYEHWGFALFHSMTGERAQRELLKLGLKPRDGLDFYNAGCLLAGEEKFAEAAKAFAKALELTPELEEALFNLALSQEKAGNVNEAKKNWKELLNVVKDEEESGQIKQHLKDLGA